MLLNGSDITTSAMQHPLMLWLLASLTLAQAFLAFIAWRNYRVSPPWERRGVAECPPKTKLSVLIPARNEEQNLPHLLSDLLEVQKQNAAEACEIEIIVCDDESTDNTAEILANWQSKIPNFRTIQGCTPPAGWKGKNHACHQLAREAQGTHLLFLDADVRIAPDAPQKALQWALDKDLDLFSLFPGQIIQSSGEWVSVPVFERLFSGLLPFDLMFNPKRKRFIAANGQFMLFRRDWYNQHQPHQRFANVLVEDMAIARYSKNSGAKTLVGAGKDLVQCRMYQNGMSALNGMRRSIPGIFRGPWKFLLPLLFLLWIAAPVFLLAASPLWGMLYWGLIFVFVWNSSRTSHLNPWFNFAFWIPQNLLLFLLTFDIHSSPSQWKGRNLRMAAKNKTPGMATLLFFALGTVLNSNSFAEPASAIQNQCQATPCKIAALYAESNASAWNATLAQTELTQSNLQQLNETELDHQIQLLFVATGYFLGQNNEQQAKETLIKLEDLQEFRKKQSPADAKFHARNAGILGYKMALSPWKAPVLGPQNYYTLKDGARLDSLDPILLQEQANAKFWAPELLGGDLQQAIRLYQLAMQIWQEENHCLHCNWRYLYNIAQLGVALKKNGQTADARQLWLKALEIQPNYAWVRDELLPGLKEKP